MSEDTLGRKFDQGKPRWGLLPLKGLATVVDLLEKGAKKYAPNNWRYVPDKEERYKEALLRHAIAFASGEWLDLESGSPHLAAVVCNALFLLELAQEKQVVTDNLGEVPHEQTLPEEECGCPSCVTRNMCCAAVGEFERCTNKAVWYQKDKPDVIVCSKHASPGLLWVHRLAEKKGELIWTSGYGRTVYLQKASQTG